MSPPVVGVAVGAVSPAQAPRVAAKLSTKVRRINPLFIKNLRGEKPIARKGIVYLRTNGGTNSSTIRSLITLLHLVTFSHIKSKIILWADNRPIEDMLNWPSRYADD